MHNDTLDHTDTDTDTNSETNTDINLEYIVPVEMHGKRIDQVATTLFAEYSREQIKLWLANGELTVDGAQQKAKSRLKGGETLLLQAKITAHSADLPEDIPLDIVYEDDDVMVINKPVGLVVHPGAGNWTGTLMNGLLFHNADLASLPRAGLVHRIDKDTSGLLVVAKNTAAQQNLSEQLKDKSVYRHYLALVVGEMVGEHKDGGTINAPIKRHPVDRVKMSVQDSGKPAVSHFYIENYFNGYTLVNVELETGRTHQIRVHMAHIGYPLVGDPVYGGRNQLSRYLSESAKKTVQKFNRQALHAYQLGFIHPVTEEEMLFHADLPVDILNLIEALG